MTRYAFLLLALFAIAARAATIPEATQSEKKINIIPESTDKTSENVSSEQELIDQSNTVNDVDNKLRTKPEDIPVEVVVETVQPALKTNEEKKESEEIIRQPIDLKNPGSPQRQEHETQNHEFDAAEQQIVQVYKQNMNDAQMVLKKGIQGVSDGIQNLIDNNEPIKSIQQNIMTLREDFIAQVNKLNGTIQSYLSTETTDATNPVKQQTKASLQQAEYGLNALKIDFTRGVKTLADGVEVFSYLRAENEKDKPSTGATTANPQPINTFSAMISNFQNGFQSALRNLTQSVTNIMNPNNTPAGVQADTPETAAPTPPAQSSWPIINFFQNLIQNSSFVQNTQNPSWFSNFTSQSQQQDTAQQTGPGAFLQQWWQDNVAGLLNLPMLQPAQATQSPQTGEKPEQQQPVYNQVKPDVESSQTPTVTPLGPIRQILQNNPISQGIANAVQKLQNINSPEKPTKPTEDNVVAETTQVDDKPKGHRPAESDNNDSGVAASEPVKEIQSEALPEVQEPMKEEVKEQTEQVVEKTE